MIKDIDINADMGAAKIINRIKKGRIDSDRKERIDSVLEELDQEKRLRIIESIQHDRRARERITYSGDEKRGYSLYVIESGPRDKRPVAAIAVAIIVVVVAFWAYSNFIQEHPMESLEILYDGDVAYVGEPFSIEAKISPSNTTDTSLEWKANLKDVTISQSADGATVLLGPSIKTGETLTVTAESDKYGKESSISIPIENQIRIGMDYDRTQVAIGEDLCVRFVVDGCSVKPQPEWSVDQEWVGVSSGDHEVTLSIGYAAAKGDSFVLTANIPNTDLSVSQRFVVSNGLSLRLTPSSSVVEAGSKFTVSAVVEPSLPPQSSLRWDVSYGGVTYSAGNEGLTGQVASDADHDVKVIITAFLDGFGVEASTYFVTSNPSKLPVEISNARDLLSMKNSSKVFELMNDIDMSSTAWVPFEFNGILNGNGHSLIGLKCDVSSKTNGQYYAGLFTENKGTINDLTIRDASITVAPDNRGAYTMLYSGVLCGVNSGTISGVVIHSSEILAHSTNIKVAWLNENSKIPEIGTGNAKSGKWYDYASLKFTGTFCNSWTRDAKMNVFCGGVAGSNSGTIIGTSSDVDIDAEVINFNYTADTARVYAGGIVGHNVGTIDDVSSSGSVHGELVLHDSGDGDGAGLGYVDSYIPVAIGYLGGLAGFSKTDFVGMSSAAVTYSTEVYAPTYFLFEGSHYNTNEKANSSGISWYKNILIGGMS